MTTDLREDPARWLKFGLVVVGVVVVAAVVWSVVPSVIFFGVFDHIVERVVEGTGWSRNLVRGVAVVGLVPLAWAITHVLSLRLRERAKGMFGPAPEVRRRSRTAKYLIILYGASYFFLMYLVYRDTSFVTVDGQVIAVRWVALTPEGCEYFEESGVHRRYGIPLQQMTPELVVKCEQINKGDAPRPLVATTVDAIQFFDPIRGTPLIFYHQHPDGRFDLFSRPGVHPSYGAPLRAVDAGIVEQVRKQFANDQAVLRDEVKRVTDAEVARQKLAAQLLLDDGAARRRADVDRQRQRYLGTSAGGPHRVVLAMSGGRHDHALTGRLAEAIGASAGVLSQAFIADGTFNDVIAGNFAQLRALEMERMVALLVLADGRSRGENSVVSGETVFKGTAQIRVIVVRPANGYAAESFATDGTGAGFSAEVAERNALDQAFGVAVTTLARYR